jgi:hypothetical protein
MESRHGPSLLPVFLLLFAALVVFFPAWKQLLPPDRWPTLPSSVAVASPTTKVWVNKQSRLYYCPTSVLYRKVTPGFFLTQDEALK